MPRPSPFLEPGLRTRPGDLAIVVLARDNHQPVTLEASSGAVDGYAEGTVINTRFGSFPHSTLIDVPWGSQIRASKVDTGSRGRKRRRDAAEDDTSTPGPDDTDKSAPQPASEPAKQAVAAASGFVHVLRPTPELWTTSLPHRTQVVYTPDYSYILSRIRARPGTRIIEAGAGSGSFTHASVRAVYNGYPKSASEKKGKVFSFEFDEARYHKMQEEVVGHSLEGMVHVTHRDVYQDGFLVDGESPQATAIFLDLPAPWKALRHLSRRRPAAEDGKSSEDGAWVSPLDPKKTVHICTFSPCIEQVMDTVHELRTLGWTEVDMVEIAHKRINIYRDRIGIDAPKEKGYLQAPADVTESVNKLREVQNKTKNFHKIGKQNQSEDSMDVDDTDTDRSKPRRNGRDDKKDDRPWRHGRLIHRPEGEIKTHTSYLVFAVLPREWSEEDEAAALAKRPCGKENKTIGSYDKASRKKEKTQELKLKHEKKRQKKEEEKAANQEEQS